MHYEVDLLVLEESLEYVVRQQLKLSPVALNGMQKSWTKKESSNSTQVKFPAALRSSGVLVKNRLTRGIFHGPMTEKMTLWVLLWHCFFMSCTLGVMGRDVVEICPAYMASTTAVPARVHHPQCHWQGSDASSWISCAPGFMRMKSTGYSRSKLTSLFLEKSCSRATDKWLNSLINFMIRRTLLMHQPLTYARPLGIWVSNRQIPICKKLHNFPNCQKKTSFFFSQSLGKTLHVLSFLWLLSSPFK